MAPNVEGWTRRARKTRGLTLSPWRCPSEYIRRLSGSKQRISDLDGLVQVEGSRSWGSSPYRSKLHFQTEPSLLVNYVRLAKSRFARQYPSQTGLLRAIISDGLS